MSYFDSLKQDSEVYDIVKKELDRQRNSLELIASENFVSPNVLKAVGTWLTNKYSEGYPGKRYYGGNEHIDEIENLAINRAKKLFGAEHANVQPHSGSSANMAAYFAMLNPGDKVMAMSLDQGGHLTHGSKVNFSGQLYNFVPYGVSKDTHLIDMDQVQKIALLENPKLIVCGYTAYSRDIDFAAFKEIADSVGAYLMADISHFAGIVAAKKHMSPFPYCDVVTSTTHKTLRGPRSAMILSKYDVDLFHKNNSNSTKTFSKAIDSSIFPGMQGGPLDHVIAGKAVAFKEASSPLFVSYIDQVIKNSKELALGLIDHGFNLVSGGTDNHLILVDLTNKKITGKQAEIALDKAGITCNKNTVPFDKRSPFDPSGIRLGTAALTTRGFLEEDMLEVASLISKVIKNSSNDFVLRDVKKKVIDLSSKYPLYNEVTL